MTTKKRTGGHNRQRTATSTVGVVRIPPSGGGMLLLEAIDSTNVSHHLALEGSRYFRHFEGIETNQDFVLAADIDQDGNFRLSEVAEFLKQISGTPDSIDGPVKNFETASLFMLQALRKSGELLEPAEIAERAREQRRALTSCPSSVDAPEMARGAQRKSEQQNELEEKQPGVDLESSNLPEIRVPSELLEQEILNKFYDYSKYYPDRAKDFVQTLAGVAEELGSPSKTRNLGLREAARRIGIANTTLLEDFRAGRLGAPDEHGKPRFSELEVEIRKARKRGSGPSSKP